MLTVPEMKPKGVSEFLERNMELGFSSPKIDHYEKRGYPGFFMTDPTRSSTISSLEFLGICENEASVVKQIFHYSFFVYFSII